MREESTLEGSNVSASQATIVKCRYSDERLDLVVRIDGSEFAPIVVCAGVYTFNVPSKFDKISIFVRNFSSIGRYDGNSYLPGIGRIRVRCGDYVYDVPLDDDRLLDGTETLAYDEGLMWRQLDQEISLANTIIETVHVDDGEFLSSIEVHVYYKVAEH